jgi:hypothetical protein
MSGLLAATAVVGAPLVSASAGGGPTVIVAAPNGSGTACTPTRPCSLLQARTTARHLVPEMTHDIDVQLDGGTYRLKHPLVLGAADSGRNGAQVRYRAAPGAHPVLSGARRITGWTRVAGTQRTWTAKVSTDFDTRQLYLGGHRIPIAAGLPKSTAMIQTPTGFLTTSAVMDSWRHPTNVAAVFHGGNGAWTQTSCNIAAIHGHAITMAQPCWSNMHLKALGVQELAWIDDPMGGFGGLGLTKTPTKFENAYELLSPGHWMIDRVAHRIYYEPKASRSPNQQPILAPTVTRLLRIAGTEAHPAHDITVSGLTFAYAGWTATDGRNGFPQMQADWYLTGPNANNSQGTCGFSTPKGSCPFASWTRTPANVALTHTRRVDVVGNTFTHLGGAGLDVYDGSVGDLVKGNEFTDISASAIQLGSTDDPHRAIDRDNTIADNYIHRVADQYLGGVGIWLGYTTHSVVTHNQLDQLPYTGISIGWGGWHANLLQANSDANINADNVVSDNLIYNYMLQLGDGGAIYSNGSQASSLDTALQIAGNVAYNGINTDFSIYTDAASQYVLISRNFVYYQPLDSFSSGGCRTVGHIRLHDNFFAPGGPVYPCFATTDINHWHNFTVCENPPPSQSPLPIVSAAGLEPSFRHLVQRHRPVVSMVGPSNVSSSGGKVLISGSGFGPGATVSFGSKPAAKARVLSANYILATAPKTTGKMIVTVSDAHGASRAHSLATVTLSTHPAPCIDYLGTGLTTSLVTG